MNISTKAQRQLIAIGCGQLGIDADLRHEMLEKRFGVSSSTLLSRNQAGKFIEELRAMGFAALPGAKRERRRKSVPAASRSGGKVVRMVNQDELDKIAAVAGLIRWKYKDGLDRWMKKRFEIEKVRTAKDAWLVIEGLKKMFENRMKKDFGEDWWAGDYDDPGIQMYIHEHCPVDYR